MRRRRQQRAPWTGPTPDQFAQDVAERGRAKAVRHTVGEERQLLQHQDVRANPSLEGRPFWAIEISGKQARFLYAAVLAQTGGYSGYSRNWAGQESFCGTLPKTRLFWWYDTVMPIHTDTGKTKAYICVGSWKSEEMEYYQTTMGHVERRVGYAGVGR